MANNHNIYKFKILKLHMVKKELSAEEIIDLLTNTIRISGALIFRGESVNLPKLRIIKYIMDRPEGVSRLQISKDLKIDYKSVYRYCEQLEKSKALTFGKGNKNVIKDEVPPLTLKENK